jgi:hypothetical protein
MAFSNAILERMNMGNKQAMFYSCVADAATGTIVTGLKAVDAIAVTPKSLTTGAVKFVMNEGVSGTSTAGTIAVTGAASGDEFYAMVYGH